MGLGIKTAIAAFATFAQVACHSPNLTSRQIESPSPCLGPAFGIPASLSVPGYVRHRGLSKALVFVHGLWGDGRNTWLNSSGTYWPSLVSNDDAFHDFDIYVHDYPSPKVGSTLSIPDLVTDMRTRLASDRVFEAHEEISFVGHSMGGLVIRGLLLRYRSLARQVPVIFFYGTPTTGSVLADRIVGPIQSVQTDALRTLEFNSFLQAQQGDWLAAGFASKSYCAFETDDILFLRVVPRQSATTLCTSPPQAVLGNHSEIVKPRCFGDMQHVALRVAIGDLTGPTRIAPVPQKNDIQTPKQSAPHIAPSDSGSESHQPKVPEARDQAKDSEAARRYVRAQVQSVAVALTGQTGSWRKDALQAAGASLPDDLAANEMAVLLGSERGSWRLDLVRILVKHARPRSLRADVIPDVLADEDGYREDILTAVAPYIEVPITGVAAIRILGKTSGCKRSATLRPIASLIQRPIAADDVRLLLDGVTGSCRSEAVGYLFGR